MLDFSKDHKFKLDAENVNNFSLKIQIKRSAPPLQKSKWSKLIRKILKETESILKENVLYQLHIFIFIFHFYIIKSILISDPDLAEVRLGPDLGGPGGCHWRAMIADPGERLFVWHKTSTDN